jgi:hypothetical protein
LLTTKVSPPRALSDSKKRGHSNAYTIVVITTCDEIAITEFPIYFPSIYIQHI